MRSLRSLLAAGVLALAALTTATSDAKAITWNVTGTFEDGGELTGWFIITQYGYIDTQGSGWFLITTPGDPVTPTLTGFTYNPPFNANNDDTTIEFRPDGFGYFGTLALAFENSLLVPGTGVNPLIGGLLGPSFECVGWVCPNESATRYLAEGLATTSAVPIPAALPLFAGGLGLMGWMARRRRGQAAHA